MKTVGSRRRRRLAAIPAAVAACLVTFAVVACQPMSSDRASTRPRASSDTRVQRGNGDGYSTVAVPAPQPRRTTEPKPTMSAPATSEATDHAKKGIASTRFIWSDLAALRALHVSWTYGWSPWVPPSTARLEMVPMMARPSDVTNNAVTALTAGRQSGAYRYLLGFNEPDIRSQANMTPMQAISLWPRLEATGLRLGSPAVGRWRHPVWLARFMALAQKRGLRVDFIALHIYVDFTRPSLVSQVRNYILRMHRLYHRPVWVTEVAALDIRAWHQPMRTAPSTPAALQFMRRMTSMLDATSCVARYAWYADFTWSPMSHWSSMYDDRNHLTPMGRAFARLGTAA